MSSKSARQPKPLQAHPIAPAPIQIRRVAHDTCGAAKRTAWPAVPDALGDTFPCHPPPADQPAVRQRFDQLLAALYEQRARLRALLYRLEATMPGRGTGDADREALVLAIRTCLVTIDLRRAGYEL